MKILVVNTGSSSIKTVLYQHDTSEITRLLECTAINIGTTRASIDTRIGTQEKTQVPTTLDSHIAAIEAILDTINTTVSMHDIHVVAYRVVYGGATFFEPTVIDDSVLETLATFNDIDPEHAPLSHAIISDLRRRLPDVAHIACFDTAFFHDIPDTAQIVPIPRKYRELGIRRYGYHGLSYEYLSRRFGEIAGETAKRGRVIYAHLGSGASIAATLDARPIDMTMGLTPTSGLVMGNRTGDIDPSLAWLLHNEANLSLEDYQQMINKESGLLAVSELSNDMYILLQNQATNPHAALAVELFCYQARKAISALAATIGGVDSLIFSGGMGEQAPEIRRRICEGLAFLGISLDYEANDRHDELISAPESRVGVHIIPTDESLSIAHSILSMNIQIKETA